LAATVAIKHITRHERGTLIKDTTVKDTIVARKAQPHLHRSAIERGVM